MVPILDVKAKINSSSKEIVYMFYQKPMSNRLVTLKTSAMTMRQKMTILTQECFRRLHNSSPNLPVEKTKETLDRFMEDLVLSGYNENDRNKTRGLQVLLEF